MAMKFINPTYSINGDGTAHTQAGAPGGAGAYNAPPTTANAGDRVLFCAGTTWAGKLSFVGDGAVGRPIVIGAYEHETASVTTKKACIDGTGQDRCLQVSGGHHYVEVQDLEMFGVNAGTRRLLYFGSTAASPSHGCKARRLLLRDMPGTTADANAIQAFGDDLEVSDCQIRDIGTDGIWSQGARQRILRNRIERIGQDGRIAGDCVQIFGDATLPCVAPVVLGNLLDHRNNSGKQCVIVQDSGAAGLGGLIAFNECYHAPFDGVNSNNSIYVDIPGVTVRGNLVFPLGANYGVFFAKNNGRAVGNVVVGARNGITHGSTTVGGLTANNTVVDCTVVGIYQDNDSSFRAYNNILLRCAIGIGKEGPAVEDYNLYFGCGINNQNNGGTPSWGTHNLFVDPQLDEWYRPLVGSPCRGAGFYASRLAHGATNPPDIGAYQYLAPRSLVERAVRIVVAA